MYLNQLNPSKPADALDLRNLDLRTLGANPRGTDETESAFAEMFEEILQLSEEQGATSSVSSEWCDNVGAQTGLLEEFQSTKLQLAIRKEEGSNSLATPIASSGTVPVRIQQYPASMDRILTLRDNSNVVTAKSSDQPPSRDLKSAPNLPLASSTKVSDTDNVTSTLAASGKLDRDQLARWMDAHALTRSSHHCAMYCRMGMEAAGLATGDRPRTGDAGDYGPFLLKHGAQVVPVEAYKPQVGDTVVFAKTDEHPFGHIEIFDGHQWVSDFMQHSFSPYQDPGSTPPFTIYRLS